jgi:hypothetical protein
MKKEKTHNMFLLMLVPWFKSLCLVSSFVGCEQGISIIEKHDKKSLQPMLLKGYHHLHLMINYLNHKGDEHCSLDIFEMVAKCIYKYIYIIDMVQ